MHFPVCLFVCVCVCVCVRVRVRVRAHVLTQILKLECPHFLTAGLDEAVGGRGVLVRGSGQRDDATHEPVTTA